MSTKYVRRIVGYIEQAGGLVSYCDVYNDDDSWISVLHLRRVLRLSFFCHFDLDL